MNNSQSILDEIIKTAPGFIGDTARHYAISFPTLLPQEATRVEIFNKAFTTVLYKRSLLHEIRGSKTGNLLLPIYKNGVERIHQCFNEIGIDELRYKIDLPTMVLYAMMLESEPLRVIFEKANDNDSFYMASLKVIHHEVSKSHLNLEKIKEEEFVQPNIGRLRKFITLNRDASGDALRGLINKMFVGGKPLDLGDNSGDK